MTALLDGRTDALASVGENSTIAFAADVVGPLIGHAQYAPTAWVGRMHAEPARRANHRMVAIRGPWIEGIGETHEA